MTAAKNTVTKKKSVKKSSPGKAKKRATPKAGSKRKASSKKTRKASVRKSTTRKASAKKATVKKSTAKKADSKKAAAKKKTKKASVKKKPKKAAAKKATTKKATTKKKAAARKTTAKKTTAKKTTAKKVKRKKVTPKSSRTQTAASNLEVAELREIESMESLESLIDSSLLENFEGWSTPDAGQVSDTEEGRQAGSPRAEREADFDELLESDKPVENWDSTSVFDRDSGVDKVLSDSATENVAVTSLVVVPETSVAEVKECRIDQPDPAKETEFEEFAAEEIISILDESLALDVESTSVQAVPKDVDPKSGNTAEAHGSLADEAAAATPSQSAALSGFLSRLWRMLISSDPR